MAAVVLHAGVGIILESPAPLMDALQSLAPEVGSSSASSSSTALAASSPSSLPLPPQAEASLKVDRGDGHAAAPAAAALAEEAPEAGGLAEGASSSNDSFPTFSFSSSESLSSPVVKARSQDQYLVDNSQLHSKHAGLSYRFSKRMGDLDKEHFELYGTIIAGESQGDWLRVGDRYLPINVNGKTVLSLQSVSVDVSSPDENKNEDTYLVVQPQINSSHKGISYRWSKKLTDRDVGHHAPYNSTVKGTDEGDGWIKVGDRYLPMQVDGKRVLVSSREVGHNSLPDDMEFTFGRHPVMWLTIAMIGLGAAFLASLMGPAPTRRPAKGHKLGAHEDFAGEKPQAEDPVRAAEPTQRPEDWNASEKGTHR
jgi:hypothetical protein